RRERRHGGVVLARPLDVHRELPRPRRRPRGRETAGRRRGERAPRDRAGSGRRMTLGAQAIVETFVRAGVDRLFVFPGGTIAPVLDAALDRGLQIFCARHEQGAGYAALAVARLTRRPQVVLVTSGPGVTNVVTPVADAYFDSVPLVVLTGQVGTGDL